MLQNQMKKERQKLEQECKELERRQTDAEKELKVQLWYHVLVHIDVCIVTIGQYVLT